MPSRSFSLQLTACAILACLDASSACVASRPAGEALSIPTVASIPVAPMAEATARETARGTARETGPASPPVQVLAPAPSRVDESPRTMAPAMTVEPPAATPENRPEEVEPPADAEPAATLAAAPRVLLGDELPHRRLHMRHGERADPARSPGKRHGHADAPSRAVSLHPVPHAKELREALRASWPAVEECYAAGLAKHADASGNLELLFRARSTGEVVEVAEDGDPRFADVDVTRCVLGVYRTARLPPGRVCTSRETTFAYSLHLEARR